jgi:hypothetical protein
METEVKSISFENGDDFLNFMAISSAGQAAFGKETFQAVCDRIGGEKAFVEMFSEDRQKLSRLAAECAAMKRGIKNDRF